MATAHLIGMFTGTTPTEEQIVALASSTPSEEHSGRPIYHLPTDLDHPNETGDGAATEDMPLLMAHYGLTGTYTDDDVASEVGLATGMAALREYLDIGKAALAVADADILWDEQGAQYGPHAVVVTGIDDTTGIVHINDSGPRQRSRRAGEDQRLRDRVGPIRPPVDSRHGVAASHQPRLRHSVKCGRSAPRTVSSPWPG